MSNPHAYSQAEINSFWCVLRERCDMNLWLKAAELTPTTY